MVRAEWSVPERHKRNADRAMQGAGSQQGVSKMAISTWNFGSVAEGLQFKIEYDSVNNTFTVTVLTGSMNVNALYWTDNDGTSNEGSYTGFTGAKSESSLNMNGTGYDWDGGLKVSDAGLGKTPPPSYITADPNDAFASSYTFSAGSFDLSKFDTIGIRATSTSSAGGSIKWVNEGPDDAPPPPQDNHFPEYQSLSHITLYWRTSDLVPTNQPLDTRGLPTTESGGKPAAKDPDGWFTVKFNYGYHTPIDLDTDPNGLAAVLQFLVSQGKLDSSDIGDLAGVSIFDGSTTPKEIWYDLDNNPGDTDMPPAGIPGYPIEANELDLAYGWNGTNWIAI